MSHRANFTALGNATRLSRLRAMRHGFSSHFCGLARLSLLMAFASMLPGCLIDDPPDYTAPKQTPARLDYRSALPLLDQVIVAKTQDKLTFHIAVESEDAGDELTGILLLDYAGGADDFRRLTAENLSPSTLDDTSRFFSLDYVVKNVSSGCHRFTLRVTHSLNVDIPRYPEVVNAADLAEAYWWANIDVDPAQANALANCPIASRGTTTP